MHKPDAPVWATEWVRRIQMTKPHGIDDEMKRVESEIGSMEGEINDWIVTKGRIDERVLVLRSKIKDSSLYYTYLKEAKARGEK